MSSNGPFNYESPQVIGVLDPSLDPEGYIPYPLLSKGIDVVIPLWPSHATQPGERDKLIVRFEQTGQIPVEIINIYFPADMKPEFIIRIDPMYLLNDGVGELWYEVYDSADHPTFSNRRKLTIDHTVIPVDLKGATFRDADLWGYVNCSTSPAIWTGIWIMIPPLTAFQVGDSCEVLWRGYSSLNASGVEMTRVRWKNFRPSLSLQDIQNGYSLTVQPYEPHIEPMVNKASASVLYRIFRGARLVGSSELALLKIDRLVPGEIIPCGP